MVYIKYFYEPWTTGTNYFFLYDSKETFTNRFGGSNGIRQGGISSPIFWNLYLDRLFTRIRKLGLGCHVAGTFLGIFIYADDIFLFVPK